MACFLVFLKTDAGLAYTDAQKTGAVRIKQKVPEGPLSAKLPYANIYIVANYSSNSCIKYCKSS